MTDRADLQASSRTTATLAVLAAILVIAVLWGLHAATKPFPGKAAATPICQDVAVAAGDTIQTGQVLVNVLNASDKSGLARSTRSGFAKFGFGSGQLGDTAHPLRGARAEVWTTQPRSPAVLLVASYLGHGARVVRKDSGYLGITVVVGDRFRRLHRGMASITAAKDTEVCEPTAVNDGLA